MPLPSSVCRMPDSYVEFGEKRQDRWNRCSRNEFYVGFRFSAPKPNRKKAAPALPTSWGRFTLKRKARQTCRAVREYFHRAEMSISPLLK